MIEEAMTKYYKAMTLSERVSFLSHSLVDVMRETYEEKCSGGLDVLIRNVDAILGYGRELQARLKSEEMTAEITLQLAQLKETFMNSEGISEEFITGLEDLLKYAQECQEATENNEEAITARDMLLENMRRGMWLSEQRAISSI